MKSTENLHRTQPVSRRFSALPRSSTLLQDLPAGPEGSSQPEPCRAPRGGGCPGRAWLSWGALDVHTRTGASRRTPRSSARLRRNAVECLPATAGVKAVTDGDGQQDAVAAVCLSPLAERLDCSLVTPRWGVALRARLSRSCL